MLDSSKSKQQRVSELGAARQPSAGPDAYVLEAQGVDQAGLARQALRSLRESDERLAACLENMLDCIISMDHHGRVVEWNAAAERTFGYGRDEVLGEPLAELIIPPALRAQHRAGLARYLASGQGPLLGKRLEITAIRKGGSEFPVELAISPVPWGSQRAFTACLRDISVRKQAESRLAAHLAITQILAESPALDDAIQKILRTITKMLGWVVGAVWTEDANAGVLRCLIAWHEDGVSVEKFLANSIQCTFARGVGMPGRVWANLKPAWIPDVSKDTNFPRAPFAAADGLHSAFAFPILVGETFHGVMEFFSREIREPDKELLGMFAAIGGQIGQFIQRKAAEDALFSAKESADQANRTKDQFLATLSHELRTPLTPVLAGLASLLHNPALPEPMREDLGMLQRNVELEVRLIDDLLDLTRIAHGKLEIRPQAIDINRIINQCLGICRDDIKARKLTAKTGDTPARPWVRADPARLQQVLWNLLKNAIKFTPEGGSISIRAYNSNDLLVVDIADTGIGIEAELLPRLFNAFEQGPVELSRRFGGLGLGLAIAKRIVDLHGGKLVAHSQGKGHGATFTLSLPAIEPPAQSPPMAESPAQQARLALRILLVEDHADTAQIMARLLAHMGHQVTIAASLAEGLKAAASGPFELIISDIGLPDGSGLDLLRQLRQPVPAIALTGYGQDADIAAARAAGFGEHLIKPIDMDRLSSAIARLCAGRP